MIAVKVVRPRKGRQARAEHIIERLRRKAPIRDGCCVHFAPCDLVEVAHWPACAAARKVTPSSPPSSPFSSWTITSALITSGRRSRTVAYAVVRPVGARVNRMRSMASGR